MTGTLRISAKMLEIPVVAEINLLWGDVPPKNKIIDVYDLSRIGKVHTKKIGDPEYDPDCDLNRDGVINNLDLDIAGKNNGLGSPDYVTPYYLPKIAAGKYIVDCTYNGKTLTREFQITDGKTTVLTFDFTEETAEEEETTEMEYLTKEMFKTMMEFMMPMMMMFMVISMMTAMMRVIPPAKE